MSTSTTDKLEESKTAAKSVEPLVQTKIAPSTPPSEASETLNLDLTRRSVESASNSSSDNGDTVESLREQVISSIFPSTTRSSFQLEQQKKVISRLEGKLELIRQKEEQEEELMEEMVNIEAMQNIRDLRAQNEALKLEIQTLRSLTKNEQVLEIESTTTRVSENPTKIHGDGSL